MALQELNHSNFDDAIEKNVYSIIEFSAAWCAPCKAMQQSLEELSEEHPDILFASVPPRHCE